MSWDPDACFTPLLSEYLTTHLVTLAAFSTQICMTRNGRNEICSFSWTPQSGQRCEQDLSHLVHQGLPSSSHSLPRYLLSSLCLSLFILHPFCFTFGTCRIFINSLARLPLRPVQRGAEGGGWVCGGTKRRGGGVSTGLNPVLGGRYESSSSMNRHATQISPSSCRWTWGEL